MPVLEIESTDDYRDFKELLLFKRVNGQEELLTPVKELSADPMSVTILSPVPLAREPGVTLFLTEEDSGNPRQLDTLVEGVTLRVSGGEGDFGTIFRCYLEGAKSAMDDE